MGRMPSSLFLEDAPVRAVWNDTAGMGLGAVIRLKCSYNQNTIKSREHHNSLEISHFLVSIPSEARRQSKHDQNFPQATPNAEHNQHAGDPDQQGEFAHLQALT
jgi:hypothetical protein